GQGVAVAVEHLGDAAREHAQARPHQQVADGGDPPLIRFVVLVVHAPIPAWPMSADMPTLAKPATIAHTPSVPGKARKNSARSSTSARYAPRKYHHSVRGVSMFAPSRSRSAGCLSRMCT